MKASFTISNTDRGVILIIGGELNVQTSRLFKDHLDGLTARDLPVQLSLQDVSGMDVSAIQIIYLFRKKHEAEGAVVEVILPSSESLITLLNTTGLLKLLM